MQERLKGLAAAVLVYALIIVNQLGIAFAIRFVTFDWLTTSLLCLYILGIAVLIFWLGQKLDLLGTSFAPIKKHLGLIFIAYACIFANNLLAGLILTGTGGSDPANQVTVMKVMSLLPSSVMLCMTIVFAPISEEVLCRGIIPRLVFKGYEKFGYLVGAFIFALLHNLNDLTSPISWLIYGGMSLIITFLAYRTKHLEVSMGLHVLVNSIAMLMILFLKSFV